MSTSASTTGRRTIRSSLSATHDASFASIHALVSANPPSGWSQNLKKTANEAFTTLTTPQALITRGTLVDAGLVIGALRQVYSEGDELWQHLDNAREFLDEAFELIDESAEEGGS